MKTIWKHPVPVDDEWHAVAGVPRHFEAQDTPAGVELTVWFETPVEPYMPVEVRIFGTGHPVPDEAEHVGTWVGPTFVWHLYERPVE